MEISTPDCSIADFIHLKTEPIKWDGEVFHYKLRTWQMTDVSHEKHPGSVTDICVGRFIDHQVILTTHTS